MVDKIKNYVINLLQPLKSKMLSLVLGSLALISYLFILKSKNQDLEEKLVVSEDTNKLEENLIKEKEAHDEANKDESDYQHVRDAYLRQQRDDSGDSK